MVKGGVMNEAVCNVLLFLGYWVGCLLAAVIFGFLFIAINVLFFDSVRRRKSICTGEAMVSYLALPIFIVILYFSYPIKGFWYPAVIAFVIIAIISCVLHSINLFELI